MSLYLGLDVGTQGTQALVLDAGRGEVVARAARSYGLIEGLEPGAAEQHPDTWIEAVRGAAGEALTAVDATRLSGVGVSGQQHGCVVLDAGGAVVRPAKLWCDTATAGEAAELSEVFGRAVPAGFTAPKVLWLQRREPESWARAAAVMLPHDYVNSVLCGFAPAEAVTEAGDASGTGYFDPVRRAYDEAALEHLDLGGRVPRLVEPGQPAGELSAAGAELLGLPARAAGLPVSAGGGDNMMSAIGSGAVVPGVAVCSLGTSATVFGRSDRPVVDPEGLIAPFCDSTGGWLPLLCVMNATGVLEEIRAAFDADHATLTAEAARVPPGCDGLLFLPFLNGERVPDLPRASGTLLGLRPGTLSRGALDRAALEGVALNLAWGVERLRGLGLAVDSLRLAGGGADNALWRRILADALGAEVVPLLEAESGALGAAIQAAWTATAAGLEELTAKAVKLGRPLAPEPAAVEAYMQLGARFREQVARQHA